MMYQREKAVAYAHRWAYSRNPLYLNFNELGGDCTNFVSQCIHTGEARMNYTPTFGWYYINGKDKAPAWTGVPYLYKFLIQNKGAGPYGVESVLEDVDIGDILQLSLTGGEYGHSLLVVQTGKVPTAENTLIATHSSDADFRPLSSYVFQKYRCIHIVGVH